jgi:Tol biopolymer transport system component
MSDGESNVTVPGAPSKRLFAVFGLEFALALFASFVAWRLIHTSKPPLDSEARAVTRLAWVGSSGYVLKFVDLRGRYVAPSSSDKGHSILLTRLKPGDAEIWALSMTGQQIKPLGSGNTQSALSIWLPGSDGFVFSMWTEGRREIFEATSDGGSRRQLFKDNWSDIPESWSPDGQWLAFTRMQGRKSQVSIVNRNSRKAQPFIQSTRALSEVRFSPDGKWVALTVATDGLDEIYAAPVNLKQSVPILREDNLIRISNGGGHSPQWGSDSNELFYIASDRTLMKLSGHPSKSSRSSIKRLFSLSSLGGPQYQYRFGGYCIDRQRNEFIVPLEYLVH